ncbi:MAG: hypothetical protein JO250_14730, partial [Armatimonadetes bacterium]|nr:hypothetical protein [Armatimonadota bacterium]
MTESAPAADPWLPDQILYQVFPDRFAIGRGQTVAGKISAGLYGPGAAARSWDELPATAPNINPHEFFGGDLWGVIERLDYLQDLGVTGLYLTPIFTAPSNHKYDTLDHESVDPAFGGDEAFTALAAEAQTRGLALILDGVFNHISQSHRWNTREEYADRLLTLGGERQYWWGHASLPELDLGSRAVRDYFLGPEGVVRRWLRRGARGWRLDTGQDLGRAFVRAVRDAARAERPDAAVFPELVGFADDWVREDGGGAGADGVMNYYSRTAILDYARGDISARLAGAAFDDVYARFGHDATLRSWNMQGSHDMDRTRTHLGS